MSAKLATLDLVRINIFSYKFCDLIIVDFDVTNIILWRDSNYIINMVMWPKFGNSSISMRKVVITSTLSGFEDKKLLFLRGNLGLSSIIWDWQ